MVSLTAALRLLARESGLSLYAEVFLKPRQALPRSTGKSKSLLNDICAVFGCRWVKVGNDYLVTSKAWALDRVEDVPQVWIDRWEAARIRQNGVFAPDNCFDMARHLTPQQFKTIAAYFDNPGLLRPANQEALRLAALLTPTEIKAAFKPEGIALPSLDAERLQLLRALFGREDIAFPVLVHLENASRQSGMQELCAFDVTLTDHAGASEAGRIFLGTRPLEAPRRTSHKP